MTDQIDIAALKAGDQTAFKMMVALFQDRVYRICFGFLASQHEAEDAAQEVFIEVFHSIRNFRGDAQLSTWVHRIAVTKSLDAIRKKRTRKRFAFLAPVHDIRREPELAADPSDGSHPFARLENRERERVLRMALERLPDSQRAAFTLHEIEGVSYEEISTLMGVSLASVESLIHRARKNLRKHLYDYYHRQQE